NVTAGALTDIVSYAREYGIDAHITRENYTVLARFIGILKHVEYLDQYKEMFMSVNGLTQTKATEEERKLIDDIARDIFKRDYTWREAREISASIADMNYYEDIDFPHNVEKLRDAISVKPMTLFDKVEDNVDLESDISKLNSEAKRMFEKLLARGNIRLLFDEPCSSKEEAYLRRMILTNWDVAGCFRYIGLEEEEVKSVSQDELIKGVELSPETLSLLFDLKSYGFEGKEIEHEEGLVDLACGTLFPFIKGERIKDIFDLCREMQMRFGINKGIVGYGDKNIHELPNHDKLVSIPHDSIKPLFKRLQSQYDYLYDNASDAEFLEGAVEIYGDILVSQVFREGNKRTAKSIFNAMLLSRGIIPPVNDLHEQEKRLWLDIAYGRFERYMKAKYKLLLQAADVKRQFKEETFSEPVTLYDMEDARRAFKD
ncbi:MAG: hypothetical protein K2L98_01940, partial [Bacilli bacterium]|nr:hypothetical protein [Bacilli bacterium]